MAFIDPDNPQGAQPRNGRAAKAANGGFVDPDTLDDQQARVVSPPPAARIAPGEVEDFALRAKLSFAQSPQQEAQILAAQGMEPAYEGGRLHIRQPSGELLPVDRPGFSLADIADIAGYVPEFVGTGIGTVAGGIAGTGLGPPGMIAGGAGGGAIGATGGRQIRQSLAELFGAQPETAQESLRRGAEAAGFGLASMYPERAVVRALRPGTTDVSPGVTEANRLLSQYTDEAGRPLVLTPRHSLQETARLRHTAENVAEKSLFGAGRLLERKAAITRATENLVDDFIDQYGARLTPTEAGIHFQEAIQNNSKAFRTLEGKVWSKVDDLAGQTTPSTQTALRPTGLVGPGGEALMRQVTQTVRQPNYMVNTTQIKAAARKLQEKRLRLAEATPTLARSEAGKVTDELLNMPDQIPFSTAIELASELSSKTRIGTEVLSGPEKGMFKYLSGALNRQIDQAGSRVAASGNQSLTQAYREAQQFTKEGHRIFNSRVIRKVVDQNPELAVDTLMRRGQLSNIKIAEKAVGPQQWQNFQSQAAMKLLAPDSPQGLVGTRIARNLANAGDDTVRQIFKGRTDDLKTLARTIELAQRGPAAGVPGGQAIQLAQPGALLYTTGLAAGLAPGGPAAGATAAAVLLAPPLMARILTHPQGIKWLTVGLQAPRGSKEAIRAGTILSGIIGREKLESFIQPLSEAEARALSQQAAGIRENEIQAELSEKIRALNRQ
jgi:hypothetical protein